MRRSVLLAALLLSTGALLTFAMTRDSHPARAGQPGPEPASTEPDTCQPEVPAPGCQPSAVQEGETSALAPEPPAQGVECPVSRARGKSSLRMQEALERLHGGATATPPQDTPRRGPTRLWI